MKPISSVSAATQQKPYLPPKPIRYRTPPASVAFYGDLEHRLPPGLKPPSRDQFDQQPLSFPRSQIDQGPLARPRYQYDQGPRRQPPTNEGRRFSPSPKDFDVNRDNGVAARVQPGGGGRSLLSSSDRRHPRHSQSRCSERMKLERERFLANLVQSEEDSSRLTSNSVGESATESGSRKLRTQSNSTFSHSLFSNTGSTEKRLNADDHSSPTMTTEFSVTSLSNPNKTSSCATKPAIVTSSTMEVTSPLPYTKPSVTSSLKESTVTSSEVTGTDVIYDEPLVDIERKSLERLVLVDGYLKLRSDVVDVDSVRRKTAINGLNKRNNDPSKPEMRPARSSESVDRLEALLDFSDYHGGSSGKPLRSSFVDPNGPPSRRSVYIELGEYQTLLKHSRNDDDECLYSLPQPLCYSEDTLKAVKLITEKYDTFKRRQLRDLSFRDGAVTNHRKGSPDGVEPPPSVLPQSSVTESNNNKSNEEDCSVQGAATAVADTVEPDVKPSVKGSARDDVAKPKQSGSLLLRDYCNTLETGVDGASGGLSKLNLMRIELFYRSQEASVYVCRCLADLFVGTSVGEDSCPVVHQHTGVPVWLLNSGEGVRCRELLLVVAERETGFPLWQDKINYLSNYDEVSPGVHSLHVSGSLRKTVRLHMFCQRSAAEFLARFHEIAADPNDDLWKISSKDATKKKSGQTKKVKKKTSSSRRKRSRLSKASISQPCNFVHISRVDLLDPNFRAAFSGLIPLRPGRSTTDSSKAFDGATGSMDPSRAFDIASSSEDPNKDFVNVDSEQNDNFESAADNYSTCEFRPRLPTR